ncbi:DUF4154 domain-containing protein [Sphingomonas sp. MAH-20]|uniref:DUF4154 domain-containing protein n=1 Tax=Sphingomonas horti TaxID=2682842 RepID=A0A6I4IXB5_9SPHN|nr:MULTISPECIES: YfiR family protein [Sphingomonas]MBA2920453.1 YfiR family protein [Sphingomonas sp. CGMCC 1.13658]MVO76706.1 DUF4154 domain-containing protein [Sphingomonas horti]
MRLRLASWLLPIALLAPAVAPAQSASEVAVKAAFLAKFGAYVTWPDASGPIVICAVGSDVFGNALDRAVAGQQIDGRALVVRRLDSVDRGSGCSIAYLAGSARQTVPAALTALRSAPVLTVTDSRESNARGMIHFRIAQSRVRFYIDDRVAAESGLGISSKLLALALGVRARGR